MCLLIPFQKKTASKSVLCLCVKWAKEILIGCESSIMQLLHKKPYKDLLQAVLDLGFHHLPSITLCVGESLTAVLAILPFNQVSYE